MPAPFQLLASHPALDFVNTLDNRFVATGPIELLPTYTDLLAFIEQAGVLNTRQISALRIKRHAAQAVKVLSRAHDLRESLASAFYEISAKGRPPHESLMRIEEYSLEAQSHRQLVWIRASASAGDEAVYRANWDWESRESDVELPLWAIAQSAADLLTSHAMVHVHECGSPSCRWLFLDTSKNHSRRWCDMTICGNRMKARRFQARQ
jgi:predicted RNA-binding Zn ribbon-like protein